MSLTMPEPLGVDTSIGSGSEDNPILGPGNNIIPQTPDFGSLVPTPATSTKSTSDGGVQDQPFSTATGTRGAVVEFAKRFLGDPYVWGGTRPGGFDCSGLIQYVMAQKAGLHLPRISAQQATFGSRVGYDGLMPGDLVAWDEGSRNKGADHIALYIGNGYIIEAPHTGANVRIRYIGKNLAGGWGVHLHFSGETTKTKPF